jgi:SNF2 family DNA or RNA helicase
MEKFCLTRPTTFGPKPYGVRNGAELRAALGTFMLRRTLDDVGLDLPPLRVDLVRLPKMPMPEYDGEADAEESMYSTMRRLLGAAKAPAVARQVIEELDNKAYKKIVVLYYHKAVGAVLGEAFESAGYPVVGFDGSTPQATRANVIEYFQGQDRYKVFLAQQTAAGIAINLTAASEIVLVEPAWTPAENSQAIKRVHRIGSEQPVRARVFAVAGTLDENIMATITQKVKMAEELGLK